MIMGDISIDITKDNYTFATYEILYGFYKKINHTCE